MIECDNNNEILETIIKELPSNQGGSGRHKCVICAFSNGFEDGKLNNNLSHNDKDIEICNHGSFAPIERIYNIHENQKPSQGRHKCLICAYHIGFNQSIGKLNELIRTNNINYGMLNLLNERIDINNTTHKNDSSSKKKIKINYIKEQRFKTELGLLGEKLVCKYEKENGFSIKHVSLEDDSLGYDIESSINNNNKFIEVKTTTSDVNTAFYLSKNELEFLNKNQDTFFIYRVYNYNFSTHCADLKIINAKDFLRDYTLECQSYITAVNKGFE
ncbi:MAG: DUF3883 domain-containing protein [Arcobacteraceae bacterium]